MSRIERMSLKLPASHRERAAEIAQRVSMEIAKFEIGRTRTIPHLEVPPITVANGTSEEELVQSIVTAVRTGLGNVK